MRENPRTRLIPVVAIIALGREADEERVRSTGFDGHIRKPVGPAELVAAVAAVRVRGGGAAVPVDSSVESPKDRKAL